MHPIEDNKFASPPCGRRSTERRPGAAFTLIELLVVTAVIGLLAALSLSSVHLVQSRAKAISCLSRLRQIGLAMNFYAEEDRQGRLPSDPKGAGAPAWIEVLTPQLRNLDGLRICPADPLARDRLRYRRTSYVLNEYTSTTTSGVPPDSQGFDGPQGEPILNHPASQKVSNYRRPAETFLVFEGSNVGAVFPGPGRPDDGTPLVYDDHTHPDTWDLGWPHVLADIDPYRHGRVANYLFADWHVEAIRASTLKRRIEQGENFAVIPE